MLKTILPSFSWAVMTYTGHATLLGRHSSKCWNALNDKLKFFLNVPYL